MYTEGALWKAPVEHTRPLEGRGRQQPQDAWPCFCMGARHGIRASCAAQPRNLVPLRYLRMRG